MRSVRAVAELRRRDLDDVAARWRQQVGAPEVMKVGLTVAQ